LKALTDAAQRELEVHAEGAAKENADAVAKKVEAEKPTPTPSPTPFFRRTEEV
jgi:hypothetical protein